jgi:hypothetical protein
VTADRGVNVVYKSHPYGSDSKLFDRDFLKAQRLAFLSSSASLASIRRAHDTGRGRRSPRCSERPDPHLMGRVGLRLRQREGEDADGRISLEPTEYGNAVKKAL